MTIFGLARVKRDVSLSPSVAVQLQGRLDRLADQLDRQRGDASQEDWARGLAHLLKDRETLDKALADPARFPQVPPGMPIGMGEDL